MQPSVTTCGSFPLFLRRYPSLWTPEEVAFHVFFGRPILLVEHHLAFKDPGPLLDVISMINRTAPGVRWRSVQTALQDGVLQRQGAGEELQVRPFAGTVRLSNEGSADRHLVAEWPWASRGGLESVFVDGSAAQFLDRDADTARVAFSLPPGAAVEISARFLEEFSTVARGRSVKYAVKVHARRRLSEMRANWLARSPLLLSVARSVYGRVAKRISSVGP